MSSSDFSAFALFTAGLAIFAPAASAATISPPGGNNPTGPAITAPYQSSDVVAGTPFDITWSTSGASTGCGPKIDLVLLYGPDQTQMNPLSYIQQGISTSDGSYSWTPDTSLTASDATNKYAIELVCEATNAYQYTGRFALANSNSAAGGSNSTSSSSSSASASASTTPKFPTGNSTASASGTGVVSHTSAPATAKTSTHTPVTETVGGGSMPTETEPTQSSPTAASTSSSSSSTGAASPMKTGISGLLAAAAVAAIAL